MNTKEERGAQVMSRVEDELLDMIEQVSPKVDAYLGYLSAYLRLKALEEQREIRHLLTSIEAEVRRDP
jgi:hypothetical protein